MELTDNEKKLLKALVDAELENVVTEKKTIVHPDLVLLEAEKKYESFLKELGEKLE